MRYKILPHTEIQPYIDQLHEIESSIHYPIEGGQDYFIIDHGPQYHPFFSEMGRNYFLLVFDQNMVVGTIAGIFKKVSNSKEMDKNDTGLYLAGLKLRKKYRGRGIPARMVWHAFARWPFVKEYQGWDFVYYVAMQGEQGDVNRSFSGLHLGQLVHPTAKIKLYFFPPKKLLQIPSNSIFPDKENGFFLSSPKYHPPNWNKNKKEFVLQSTQKNWPRVHLPYLGGFSGKKCHQLNHEICQVNPDALCCYGIDSRNKESIAFLEQFCIQTNTEAIVYTLSFTGYNKYKTASWIHISTAEI